ncbi:MAG: cation-translocating P-type ATPase [Oscillospiraceae bacterium]|nr:cation-translocating P-type ATPase [Oscillospiraceae bacterium]
METNTDLEKGLTDEQVRLKKEHGESNGSFDVKTKSVPQILKDNILTLFNLINVILAAFVALTGSYRNMLFMGVVLCNIAIGIFQEIRSKRIIDRLALISAPKAHLLREGKETERPVSDIVKDDIMLLASGRQICADAILAQGECEVDESLITGESDPIVKRTGDELLSGSFVISGTAKAQVIRVGAEAYANKITSGAKYVKKQNSEMMRSINSIISTVSVCIVPFALVLFFKAIFVTQQEFSRGIVSTVAALIGMIPEGLVLLTSIALAVSSIRLARRNTLCQDLYSVEHLARVDVLCLDKTGTITEGCMEVTDIVAIDSGFDSGAALDALASALSDPNPTLSAIKRRFDGGTQLKCTRAIPFSSAKKWSAAVFDGVGTYAIGAPGFVLSGEKYSLIKPLTEEYSSKGMRVLVLAHSESQADENGLPCDIEPKALVVLSDKIRESAPATLEYFRRQGVELKVISGDDPVTVANVAKKAGLAAADSYIDASTLTDEALCESAERYTIFGRVTPYQKLELVKALKARGHKVAMTGDGVNDVLALKEADCSVAMQSGSDAARNVSQLVLMDSDFASMPLVVEEGRRAINNIQRSAALFLVKTIFSFILAVVFLIVPMAYPFQPIQMTLISALTIGAPSFLLALETNRDRVRGSFISNVLKRAFPGGVSVVLGIIMLLVAQGIFAIPQEETSVIATFLTAAVCFGVLFNVCRPFNRLRAVMLALLCAAFVGASLILPSLFYIVPLSALSWGVLAVIGAISLLCLAGLTALSKKLFATDGSTLHIPARLKKGVAAAVFVLSAVFAVWFGTLLADYFALSSGNAPVIAQQRDDGSYKGIFYEISDNEIHIFGNVVRPLEMQDK